ncbi:DUF4231 domain-containing protein [Rhodococcus koreensis]
MVDVREGDVNTEDVQRGEATAESGERGRGLRFRTKGSTDARQLALELDVLVATLGDLTDDQRGYLRERWRPEVMHAKQRVEVSRRNYYLLRLPTVLGAVSLPPLASPTVEAPWARWAALVVSLVVAGCTAAEGLFRFGNRWRLYRRMLDELRREGWAYAHKIGAPYEQEEAEKVFPTFVRRSEDILRRYGEEYVTEVVVLGGSAQPADATRGVVPGHQP